MSLRQMCQRKLFALTATVVLIAVLLDPIAAACFIDDRIDEAAHYCPVAPERTSNSVLAFIDTKKRPFFYSVTNLLMKSPSAFVRKACFDFGIADDDGKELAQSCPDMATIQPSSEGRPTTSIRLHDIEMDESAYETTVSSIKDSYELMMESQATKLELGTRVAVQWTNNGQYYEAIVKEIDALHFVYVVYKIDGFLEWIDTRKDRFQSIGPSESHTKWTQVRMQDLIQSALGTNVY